MNELIAVLKKAHELASQFEGGYSVRFFGAEEFAKALGIAVNEFENGNDSVLDDLQLWFLPTSEWDDFIKLEGLELGQRISALLAEYRANSVQCTCQRPPFHYLGYSIDKLGENEQGEATLETCKYCGAIWLNYLIEEPQYSNSGRWWRMEVTQTEAATLNIANVRDFIEQQDSCFAGGSFYNQGVHKKAKPICVK